MKNNNRLYFIVLLITFAITFLCGRNAFAEDYGIASIDNIIVDNKTVVNDNTYTHGFRWELYITVPIHEPSIRLKFGNLISASNAININGNLRYYSNGFETRTDLTSARYIDKADEYGEEVELNLNWDIDNIKPGRQVKIIVEAPAPYESKPGNYSINFGFKSFDDENPTIKLNGDSVMILNLGEKYNEPNMTAYDNSSLNMIGNVDYGGLDTNKIGVYKLTYSVKDPSGNMGYAYRTVKVVDPVPMVITISNYNKYPTNKSIIVRASVNKGTLNQQSRTFSKNGTFDFVATDSLGNVATKTVEVTNIDKELPTISLKGDSIMEIEKGIRFLEPGYIFNDNNPDSYVEVTPNNIDTNKPDGELIKILYKVIDSAGNVATTTRTLKIIDYSNSKILLNDYDKNPTNKDILVKARIDNGTIIGEVEHLFTENGTFTFYAKDEINNPIIRKVTLTNIDKEIPVINILGESPVLHERGVYNYTDGYATVSDNSLETIIASTDASGVNFDIVGEYNIIYKAVDRAGNQAVDAIRKVIVQDTIGPKFTFNNYITEETSNDIEVIATLDDGIFISDSSHIFTENSVYVFEARDEHGNISKEVVTIGNINKNQIAKVDEPKETLLEDKLIENNEG